ncbi:hypothetical protein [Alkalihalobacillus sp. BA299]|nr:hypothetical protein [Alkalihalobacillus sp. BA299]
MNQVEQIMPGVFVVQPQKRKTNEEIKQAEQRMQVLLEQMKKEVEKCS